MKKTITKTTKYYDENGKVTKEETETVIEEQIQSDIIIESNSPRHFIGKDHNGKEHKFYYDSVCHDGITHRI